MTTRQANAGFAIARCHGAAKSIQGISGGGDVVDGFVVLLPVDAGELALRSAVSRAQAIDAGEIAENLAFLHVCRAALSFTTSHGRNFT